MIGIYKIQNIVTNQIYIGQSINIEERIKEHKLIPFQKNRPTYNYPLYTDMRKYGVDNFTFEIILECKKEELNHFEQYFINLYDSFYHGYNQTPGGDSAACGNMSNNHILNEEDIINIRTRYNNKEPRWQVYQDYKHLISLDTFVHIWKGKTWSWCMPEVFTKENVEWHKNHFGNSNLVKNTNINENDVYYIRQKRKEKFKRKEIYQQYKNKISESAFNAIWYYQSWKGINDD